VLKNDPGPGPWPAPILVPDLGPFSTPPEGVLSNVEYFQTFSFNPHLLSKFLQSTTSIHIPHYNAGKRVHAPWMDAHIVRIVHKLFSCLHHADAYASCTAHRHYVDSRQLQVVSRAIGRQALFTKYSKIYNNVLKYIHKYKNLYMGLLRRHGPQGSHGRPRTATPGPTVPLPTGPPAPRINKPLLVAGGFTNPTKDIQSHLIMDSARMPQTVIQMTAKGGGGRRPPPPL